MQAAFITILTPIITAVAGVLAAFLLFRGVPPLVAAWAAGNNPKAKAEAAHHALDLAIGVGILAGFAVVFTPLRALFGF